MSERPHSNHLTAEREAERNRLYADGLGDDDIARLLGLRDTTIYSWRKRRGLPANKQPGGFHGIHRGDKQEKLDMYAAGATDNMIARHFGINQSAVTRWRHRRGLPSNGDNHQSSLFKPEVQRLHRLRFSDTDIAAKAGCHQSTVKKWRRSLKLKANVALPTRHINAALRDPLYARAHACIGRGLADDVREDAISDLVEAVLSGSITVEQMEDVARRFAGHAVGQWASRYGPRSLDEVIGEDGFSMMHMIRDNRASSWLEEMGATVW